MLAVKQQNAIAFALELQLGLESTNAAELVGLAAFPVDVTVTVDDL